MNIKSLFNKVSVLSFFALSALALVYYLILSTLNQGISCDEGFYVMGYLSNQHLGNFISDYANIVRTITPIGLEENIMTYRVERLLISGVVFPFFAIALRRWLQHRFHFSMNSLLYYSLVLLACAQAYMFAAPTISYDSIQTFVYLLAFAFYFLLVTASSKRFAYLYALAIGMLLLIGVLNYFPSGLFLIGSVGLLTLVDFSHNKRFKVLLFYFLGFLLGGVIYHFLVRDLIQYSSIAIDTIVGVFTETSASRHDAGGLLSSFFLRFGSFLLFVPVVVLLAAFIKHIKPNKILSYLALVVVVVSLLVIRNIYTIYAPVYFVPVAILMALLLAEKNRHVFKTDWGTWVWMGILVVLPFFAVFGTNQNLYTKMIIFTPFWLVLFFIIYSQVQNTNYKYSATLIFTTILLAGYVYLGNFSRYHYYYTPRSSKYQLNTALRQQNIKFSKYQQQYFGNVLDTLQQYGAKRGSTYLAFGENQMTVFLAGGYVAGKLPYHWFQYKEIAKEAPDFLILFKNEEQEVTELLQDSNWHFPQDYKRIEMRPMSENMHQEELKTIVYVPKR